MASLSDLLPFEEWPFPDGASIFTRALAPEKMIVQLDDIIDDDDYTAINEISDDDQEMDESKIEQEEERIMISQADMTRRPSLPAVAFPCTPLFESAEPECAVSSPLSPLSPATSLAMSVFCPQQQPVDPSTELVQVSFLDKLLRKSTRKSASKRKSSKSGKIKLGSLPTEILRQPYGGKEGPSTGVFKHRNRFERSVGYLDKHNRSHFRLSKLATATARATMVRSMTTSTTSPTVAPNTLESTAVSSISSTPAISRQETLPPAALKDLNFFDSILATPSPSLSSSSSPTPSFSSPSSLPLLAAPKATEPGVAVAEPRTPARSSVLFSDEPLSTAESSAVQTPSTASPRTTTVVNIASSALSDLIDPFSLNDPVFTHDAMDDLWTKEDMNLFPRTDVFGTMTGASLTAGCAF